jgi:hypothetical protein
MTLSGLIQLFEHAGIRILEAGYCDMPPQPDWVISLRNFFKSEDLETSYRPSNTVQILERVFWFDQANPLPKRIWAHHPYVFGGI